MMGQPGDRRTFAVTPSSLLQTPHLPTQGVHMVPPLTNLSCYEIPASPRAAASTSPGTVIPPQPDLDDLPSIPPQPAHDHMPPLTNLSCYENPASPRAAASTRPGTVIPPQPRSSRRPSRSRSNFWITVRIDSFSILA